MLIQIHIHHLVTIHELNLEFKSGTTVITGETGTGKSILIDAILLALGARATGDMVHPQFDKAEIALSFNISQLPKAQAWLKNYDLNNNENECLIRRTIHRDGRSRCFINSIPSTLQPLRELGELLVHIHGQHEHQFLLKTDMQRYLLDQYAQHLHLVEHIQDLSLEWQKLNQTIIQLRNSIHNDKAQREFLAFQLQELNQLQLVENEFQKLDSEHKQLSSADELLRCIHYALQQLVDNENNENINATYFLQEALQSLDALQKAEPKILNWLESIKSALIHIQDTEDELRHYLEKINLSPERLTWLENRISQLFDCARKYKVAPDELFLLQQKIALEQNEREADAAKLGEWITKLDIFESRYYEKATELSQKRQKAADNLSIEITKMIRELALNHAEFHIHLEQEHPARITHYGFEKVIFQIKTNLNQPLQPLAKIASGGELSRIGLAIHIATAGLHATPSLIFDEVDVGIGGTTAYKVGQLLRCLGESHQVFCITHQAQVAAVAKHHIRVTKISENNSTETFIQYLSPQEKIDEIARMLGGATITKKTLDHARELIEKA